MQIFKSPREYFRMAGIYEYMSDPSGLLLLVRFSQNIRSLVNTTPVYRNDFFEITLSYPQQMRFNVSGIDHFTSESPTLSFIAPLEIQQCTSHKYLGEVCMLLIAPQLLEISNYSTPYYKRYQHFNPIFDNTLSLTPDQFESIATNFNEISLKLKSQSDPKLIFEEFYKAISSRLKTQLIESDSKKRKLEILESFSAQLKASPLDKKSIKNISESIAVSYTHLSDTIKEVTNYPPSHHLKQFLNNLSHTYLLHTKLTASEIAFELGFSSHAHFATFFKEANGLSPSEFRKNRNICKVQG